MDGIFLGTENGNAVTFQVAKYAAEGNAILGIRGSGKTWTAKQIAEQLLDAGVPIVVFDPIGSWRYLKVGINGKPGYPVVVAGGVKGDIELTVQSAPQIVEAAMRQNISLVVDLYDPRLSKADWHKIVASCIRLLLYQNQGHGLRHIFLEEAAEFIPQRIGRDQAQVYAECEKLARMGGNVQLGYTLINQRAEDVNKSVLELAEVLLLHRQKGRHSITALTKWLQVADVNESVTITKALPVLGQGECFAWLGLSTDPMRVKVQPIKTFHPNRETRTVEPKAAATSVENFVKKIREEIAQQVKAQESRIGAELHLHPNTRKALKDVRTYPRLPEGEPQPTFFEEALRLQNWMRDRYPQYKDLPVDEAVKKAITAIEDREQAETARAIELSNRLLLIKETLGPQYEMLKRIFTHVEESLESSKPQRTTDPAKWEPWFQKLGASKGRMLREIVTAGRMTRQQLIIACGVSRETVRIYTQEMLRAKLIEWDGDYLVPAKV